MNKAIFKAYDIRGIYPTEVDEDVAFLVGRAFVRFLSAKTIVVGHDMRESSIPLKEKIIEGITCEGADVIDIGLCTTPMLNFSVTNYNYDGGIMVSASHNPGEYNAFKMIKPRSEQVGAENGMHDIEAIIEKGFSECKTKGTIVQKDVLLDYLSRVMKTAEGIEGLKVVVDYGNGVGAISAKPAYARLDIEATELNQEPDGTFPNHPANPHDVKNFDQLIKMVKRQKADLGIFYDGDADRAAFVDDLGRIVPIDLLTVLLTKEELACSAGKKGPKQVYYDLRFSKSVSDQIKELGGIPVMMKVGNPVYKKALNEKGGILGAEFSGHIMFPENMNIDDGLFASLKTMQMLVRSQKKMSELIDGVNIYQSSDEESYEAKNPKTVYERIYAAFPQGKQLDLDGAYVDLPDGFVSVRQSQNEPQLFRIRVEARTKKDLAERLAKVQEIVKG